MALAVCDTSLGSSVSKPVVNSNHATGQVGYRSSGGTVYLIVGTCSGSYRDTFQIAKLNSDRDPCTAWTLLSGKTFSVSSAVTTWDRSQ